MRKHALLHATICLLGLLAMIISAERCYAQLFPNPKLGDSFHVPQKGAIDIRSNLLVPIVNWNYYTDKEQGDLSRVGFGLWNLGVDYYHRDNNFINLTAGESYDLKLPAALSYGFGGKDSERIMVLHFSLSHNHKIKVVF